MTNRIAAIDAVVNLWTPEALSLRPAGREVAGHVGPVIGQRVVAVVDQNVKTTRHLNRLRESVLKGRFIHVIELNGLVGSTAARR